MKQTADRLFGGDYIWSVLAAGRAQMPFAASVLLGGSARVGLEDSLFIALGKLACWNADNRWRRSAQLSRRSATRSRLQRTCDSSWDSRRRRRRILNGSTEE